MVQTVLRAAAYVRVSSYQESQEKSIADQVRMLNEIIDKDETLVNVGTYIDQGVTGKYQAKRKQFLKLIKDCQEGLVDVIYCKQIKRFGRNALETMTTIEKLRTMGIPIRFVMDDIDTIVDRDCSRLAMLASIAEDERDNMQDLMIWSMHKRLEQGHYLFCGDLLFGYRSDENHNLVIVPEEAVAVRYIFEHYARGDKYREIAAWLTAHGFKTRKGNDFCKSSINDIIKNEKYYGTMIVGKSRMEGYKVKKNNGENPKYIFENHHEGIITKELFDECQTLTASRRKPQKADYSRTDEMKGKIFCGQCGNLFIRQGRTNCVNDFAQIAFVCGKAVRTQRRGCRNKLQRIGTLEDAFVAVYNFLSENKDVLKTFVTENPEFLEIEEKLNDMLAAEKRYFELEIKGLFNDQMKKNHTKLVGEMLELQERKRVMLNRNIAISNCNASLKKMKEVLKKTKTISKFDGELFTIIVKKVLIMDRNTLIYELNSGHRIKVEVDDYYKTRDEIRRVYDITE